VTPDDYLPLVSERAVGQRPEHGDRVAAPSRDVNLAAGRDDGVRVMVGLESLYDAPRSDIDDGERISDVLGDVEQPPVAREGEPGREARAVLLRILLGECDPACGRQSPVAPVVAEDGVLVAAGDVERPTVGREGEAEEGRGLRDRLDDSAGRKLNDLDALLAPPAQGDDHVATVGRGKHRERHVPHVE
jgi:hypothetical protein